MVVQKRCQRLLSPKNHEITAILISNFRILCGLKHMKSHFNKISIFNLLKTQILIFSLVSKFFGFFNVWCVFYNICKLVILKVILRLRYPKVMNSNLKSGANWPKHKFRYFCSKTIYYERTFSPFFIFLHIWVVSQNTLCISIKITFF